MQPTIRRVQWSVVKSHTNEPSFPRKKWPSLPRFLPLLQQYPPDPLGRGHSVMGGRVMPTTDLVPLTFLAATNQGHNRPPGT